MLQALDCSEGISELSVEDATESTDPGGSGEGEEKKPAKKSKAAKRRVCTA